MKPDLLKNILPAVLNRLSGAAGGAQSGLNQAWEEVADNNTKRHAAIAGFSKGRLLVNVDSPAWAFQLNFKKSALLRRLKERCPELTTISFRIGKTH